MINYKLLKDNGIVPKDISFCGKAFIVNTIDNKKYVIKDEKEDGDSFENYNYLISRNFNYIPSCFKIGCYNIYEYIDDYNISDDERLSEIIDLVSLLHLKTTRYKNFDLDDYKVIYEKLDEEINYLLNYYSELNDLFDSEIYLSPSKYLFLRNIDKIYSAIYFSKKELDEWYDIVKNNTKQRVSFVHNNLDLSHLIRNDNSYLISFSNSKVDLPIYDIFNLYKKYYIMGNFDTFLNSYMEKYPLNNEELKLFFVKISIPFKVGFSSLEFVNVSEVKKLLCYLDSGDKLIKYFYNKT